MTKETKEFLVGLICREFEQERWYQASQTEPDTEWIDGMIKAMRELDPILAFGLVEEWKEAKRVYGK